MDLRQLTYFVRVIELRSFTKAADALRISQPAIGEQIRNLEAELDASLLIRHSRGVEPTETGRILFNKARAILAQVAEARSAVRDYEDGLRGDVTLGLTPGLTDMVAAAAIERCSRDFPGITVNVIEDVSSALIARVALAAEALSFAVVSGYDLAATPALGATRLFEEELYAVASPTLLGATDEPIAFHELARFRLILLSNGSPVQQGLKAQLGRIARAEGIELSIAYEIQAVSVVKQLAERDVGVAILPVDTVRRSAEDGRLSARRIVSPGVIRDLHLVWNAGRPLTSAEDTIRDLLVRMIMDRQNGGARP
ncbi:LysR family transcriptional regulator [Azospirillum doebereinerae]